MQEMPKAKNHTVMLDYKAPAGGFYRHRFLVEARHILRACHNKLPPVIKHNRMIYLK